MSVFGDGIVACVAIFAELISIGRAGFALVLAAVATLAAAPASAPSAIAALAVVAFAVLVLFVLGFLRFSAQQGLTVGDRNLVVVGVYFTEGEETVTVAAIFDKGCLKGGFDARYAGEVDVSFELLLVLGFKVEFFDTVTANDDNTCFLRVGGVYQHLVGHYFVSPRQPSDAACGARPVAVGLDDCGCRTIERPPAAA